MLGEAHLLLLLGVHLEGLAPSLVWLSLTSITDNRTLKPYPERPWETDSTLRGRTYFEFETSSEEMVLDGQNFLNIICCRRLE